MAESAALLEDELAGLFTGSLAHCAETLSFDGDRQGFIAASDLLQPRVLDATVDRFGAAYAGGDRRAMVSLWSQWYFGTLLVPTTAAILLLERMLPLRLEQVGIRMDDQRHHAVAVRLPDSGHHAPNADPFDLFYDLVWNHLDPLIQRLSESYGVAERLLWSNAGGYVEWTVRELERRLEGETAAAAGDRLFTARCWPGENPNPLFRPVRYVCQGETSVRRRRICCLRYLLPGIAGCGEVCPLPKVRSASEGSISSHS